MADPHPRLVFAGYRVAAGTLRRLPRPLAHALARRSGRLLWRASPTRRRVVASNLSRVTGFDADSAALRRVVRDAFDSYARYWVDATKIDIGDVAYFNAHWRILHAEHLEEALARGRGVILALPHLGSWEIGGMLGLQLGHPLTAVAEPLEPPELLEWFIAQRRAVGLDVRPLGSGSGPLLRVLSQGGVLALVADRDLTGDGIEVEFFGESTRLPAGPALLALRSGATLLPCAIYQRRGGVHEGVVHPPLDTTRRADLRSDLRRVTSALARDFEVLIRAAPAQWHVFQPNWPSTRSDAS